MMTTVYDSWEDAADALATPEERAAWAASAAAAGMAGAVSGASAPGFDATSPLSLSASAAETAPLDVAAVAAAASERARSAAEAIAAAESIPVIDDVGDVLEDGFAKQFFTDSHALFLRYDDMRRSRYEKALHAMSSNPGNKALVMAYHHAVLDFNSPLKEDPRYQAELAELERRYIQNMRYLGHTKVYRPVWVPPPERKISLSYEVLTALGVTEKFCPKDFCEEPKCTFLHKGDKSSPHINHHEFIVCRAHGDDHADDWCGCHERNEQTVDWSIHTIYAKDLHLFPRRNLIKVANQGYDKRLTTDAVHIDHFKCDVNCECPNCDFYHRKRTPIPEEFRIPHTDGRFFVSPAYGATVGLTRAGLPWTGLPKGRGKMPCPVHDCRNCKGPPLTFFI